MYALFVYRHLKGVDRPVGLYHILRKARVLDLKGPYRVGKHSLDLAPHEKDLLLKAGQRLVKIT